MYNWRYRNYAIAKNIAGSTLCTAPSPLYDAIAGSTEESSSDKLFGKLTISYLLFAFTLPKKSNFLHRTPPPSPPIEYDLFKLEEIWGNLNIGIIRDSRGREDLAFSLCPLKPARAQVAYLLLRISGTQYIFPPRALWIFPKLYNFLSLRLLELNVELQRSDLVREQTYVWRMVREVSQSSFSKLVELQVFRRKVREVFELHHYGPRPRGRLI